MHANPRLKPELFVLLKQLKKNKDRYEADVREPLLRFMASVTGCPQGREGVI